MSGPMSWLVEMADGQHGALTPQQVAASGLTEWQLRRQRADGSLVKIGTHVMRSPFIPSSGVADVAALVLDCGPGSVASGPTAAALHRLDGMSLRPPYHVTIPRGRHIRRSGAHVHTATELDPIDRTRVSGIPVLAVPRCLVDLSRYVSAGALAAAYDSALRDRLATEDAVHERIVALRSRGRYGIPKLLGVIEGGEATRGGHSWLERRFLRVCADGRLPRPLVQQVETTAKGRLVRVDFRFAGTPVVVEVLGYRWHRGDRAQMSRDVERINALLVAGLRPLQFTYDHITAEAGWVVSQVAAALAAGSV